MRTQAGRGIDGRQTATAGGHDRPPGHRRQHQGHPRAPPLVAGFSTTAIYNRRMKWPGFADAWARAVEQGFARLETQLIETASASLSGGDFDGGREVERCSFAEALNLYKSLRAEVRGGAPQRYDARSRPLDPGAVRASLLKKVEMIERGMARERQYAARADDAR
jgi:hypothetical protein